MFKKYADETMEFIKKIEADGPRLPGSDEEKQACKNIQQEIKDRVGLDSKTEDFTFAVRASIGGICYLGYAGLIAMLIYYIGGIYGTILAGFTFCCIMLFVALQVIRYTGTFDLMFKHGKSSNIITEIPPVNNGETKFTIYLGAHYDSSWCWKLSLKNPNTAIPKTAYGILGAIAMIGISVLRAVNYFVVIGGKADYIIELCTMIIPIAIIPGLYFITQYVSGDKAIASPGAMDNLSGIGSNMMIMKYFKEHPEDMPEGMRLVYLGFGAEEASLKGSLDYVKRHGEEMKDGHSYVLNVDSIADPDHFEAIIGDLLQGTKFDKTLIGYVHEAYDEMGIKAKSIYNPVGGCDSTPFCNENIPTVTIAAQNPTTTYYYHTMLDKSERFTTDTLEKGLTAIYKVIKKIAEAENQK
ncbi:MAG: M28 family peptidase [Clostridia bacterium]|nr:M28 family peptidase [Clostridia bacterium]